MEQEKKIRVAITHGDTNGVGYEVIFKAFDDPAMLELCTPVIYGSPKAAAYHAKALNTELQYNIIKDARDIQDNRVNLLAVISEEVKIDLGQPTPEAGEAALKAIDRALDDYRKGAFDVLVTAPVCKTTIKGFNGHTSYIGRQLQSDSQGLTILCNDDLRVALVTNNVAIRDVAEAITKQKIVEKGTLFHQALRRDLRISNPRIAVLALNPRCGEEGTLGDEEQEIIKPAIDELVAKGIQAFGPYAADDFFGSGAYYRFDGVLSMFHDQGQTAFKALSPENGLRLSSGLPLVRTAPAHGTCYPMAGRGQTDATSLRNAIYMAIDVLRNRQAYDEPLQNPLPKLYHEKRDDSEKVRFRSPENRIPGAREHESATKKDDTETTPQAE